MEEIISPSAGLLKSVQTVQINNTSCRYLQFEYILNIFDHHTQYFPISCVVLDVKHISGTHKLVWDTGHSENEKMITLFSPSSVLNSSGKPSKLHICFINFASIAKHSLRSAK